MKRDNFCTVVKELLGVSVFVSMNLCENVNTGVDSFQDVTKSVSLDVPESVSLDVLKPTSMDVLRAANLDVCENTDQCLWMLTLSLHLQPLRVSQVLTL